MNRIDRPAVGRRRFLRDSGIVVSLGAIVAACGEDREGVTSPGRIGNAPAREELPEGEVNDVVLLRTAQSLEANAIAVYGVAAGLDVLSNAQLDVVGRFVEDHTGHSAALGGLITGLGGEEFDCPNPFLVERAITPVVAAIGDSDDPLRDVLNTAWALETHAARSYQALVAAISEPELRREAMRIGNDENRHAATLAIAITGAPEGYIDPALIGAEEATGEFPTPYAIESTFGLVSGVPLVVGAPDEEGSRTELTLETPAANSFIYEFMSCDA